ncbi:MAG TPA: YfiR family protein [Burkholderiales bacterium]
MARTPAPARSALGAIVALALLLALWSGAAPAQSPAPSSETDIKAAFLYKFGDFVQWPPEAFAGEDRFVVGVMGADEIAEALERLVGERRVKGYPIAVRRLRPGDSLRGVHVLFVGSGESGRLAEILAAADAQPILAVTDSEAGLRAGSMINFVVENQRVRFDIALPPAERARLKISSRLLAVARKVIAS